MKYATFPWRIEGPKIQFIPQFPESNSFYLSRHIFHNHELLNTDTKNDVLILLCLKMVQNRWKYVSSMYEYGSGVRIHIGILHWPLTVAESCRLEIQCPISRTKRPRSNLAGAFTNKRCLGVKVSTI